MFVLIARNKRTRLTLDLAVMAILLSCCLTISAAAQTVTVRLVNGRNGKPVKKAKVYVNFKNADPSLENSFITNSLGEIRFDAHGEKVFGITPIGFVSCGAQPIGSQAPEYPVAEVLRSGIVSPNNCSARTGEPLRGSLIYFVVSAGWWQMFKN